MAYYHAFVIAKITMPKTPVTIYHIDDFGIPTKVETNLVGLQRRDYAQYSDCLVTAHIPKGKRKVQGRVYPDGNLFPVVVLKGWGHCDIQEVYETTFVSNDVTVKRSKHLFGASEWKQMMIEAVKKSIDDGAELMDTNLNVLWNV
jgi:hypothetical protein